MADMHRRGFLGALAGVAAVGTTAEATTMPKPDGPLVQLTVVCPRCGCQLPWPSQKRWPDWMRQAVETSCNCGYTTTVRFFAHV